MFLALVAGCASVNPPPSAPSLTDGSVALHTVTLPDDQFPTRSVAGEPATVWGHLRLPADEGRRVPAIILAHGCSGVASSHGRWADELTATGYATLLVDSFRGRSIKETCSGKQRINLGSRINDVYRGLDWLATHPRIDGGRIALMGFSQGGGVTLLARYARFQRRWMTPDRSFAAYLAFYPATCNRRLIDESEVDSRPLRVFHGAADNWTPLRPCREYVERALQQGKDAAIFEYPDAHHGFDNPRLPPERRRLDVINAGGCLFVEQASGRFVALHAGAETRVTPDQPCTIRGATTGYHADAYRRSIQDVKAFLASVFKTLPG